MQPSFLQQPQIPMEALLQELPRGTSSDLAAVFANFLETHIKATQHLVKELRAFEKVAKRAEKEEAKSIVVGGRKRKKVVEPGRPKRPPTAYLLFLQDNLPVVKLEHPEKEQKELFSLIALRWKNVDETSRKGYQERAKLGKAQWMRDMEEFKSNKDHADIPVPMTPRSTLLAMAAHEEEEEEEEIEEGEEEEEESEESSDEEPEPKKKHRTSDDDAHKKKHKKHKKNREEKEKKKKKKSKDKKRPDAASV